MAAYMLKMQKYESIVQNCDVTALKILDEKTDNGNPKKTHMWVVRAGKRETKQLVVFNCHASRAGDVEISILPGYNRYIVSDSYSWYNELAKGPTRCRPWAHLGRKFHYAVPDHNMAPPGVARNGVHFCDSLLRIEESLDNVAQEEQLRFVMPNRARLRRILCRAGHIAASPQKAEGCGDECSKSQRDSPSFLRG